MAVVVVQNSNNRRDDFEGAVSGTNNIGSGPGPSADPDFFIQGAQSWGRRINNANADNGFGFTDGATVDMTAGDDSTWMAKVLLTNIGSMGTGGVKVRIGSATSAYYEYLLRDEGSQGDDGEFEYPIKGGWLIEPVNPNVSAWRDGTTGSPSLTAVDYFAVTGYVSTTSNAENIFIDAIDIGQSLYIYGGTSTDDPGTFQDLADHDEGQPTSGRFGHITTIEGVFFVYGQLRIGQNSSNSAQAFRFIDENKTIIFPGGRVAAGFNRLNVNMSNLGTTILELTNIIMQGRGRDNYTYFFSTAGEVDGANDEIDFPAASANLFKTGDAVLYTNEGGTESIGLTNNTEYFVETITATSISLHTTRSGAFTSGTPVNLTASSAANSEQHRLQRQPDTRPTLSTTGNIGTGTFTGCTFDRWRVISVSGAYTFTNCLFLACSFIDLSISGTAMITASIQNQLTYEGNSLISVSDLSNITNCSFDFGTSNPYAFGHAIELDGAGTWTFTGNTFDNYGPTEVDFNASTDVNATTDVITVGTTFANACEDGDAVYYEDRGGTAISPFGDGDRLYVRVSDTASGTAAFYRTREDAISDTQRLGLTAGSDETHSICHGRAAILNDTNGTVTINIAGGGDIPSTRTTGTGTTIVNNTVSVSITAVDASDSSAIENARVYLKAASGGPLPFEESVTITRSGTTATVTHTGHGLSTNDLVVISGADQDQYNGTKTITVTTPNAYTFTVSGSPTTPATGTIVSTAVIFNELTNASGVVSNTAFNFSSDQPVTGRVRRGTTSPLYKTTPISGTITDAGFTVSVPMVTDE